VADDYQSEIRVGQPIVPPRKSYSGVVVTLVVLLLIAGAAGYVWTNYDSLVEGAHHWSGTSASAGSDDTSDLAKELRDFQQQTTEALGSTRQLLETQQDQLKGLTSQIADLTAKIDRMQSGAAPAQAAIPLQLPAVQAQPAPQRPVAPARAAVTAPRKRPAAPVSRPEGAISVGGAPLPGATAPPR
jgi:hypothetical protein